MAIGDDFSVAVNGDIRYTGTTANYTVIAFHRWLGDLMDDAQAAGNDLLDITDSTASERATDNLVTLNSPYNIDDIAARHLYDGSIVQSAGAEIYDGIVVFAPAGTYLQVLQSGAPVSPNFWTTGLNADAAQGISHRFMVRVRTGGADVDGRRLVGQTREVGKTFGEFRINGTSRGNNVLALTFADDLNNATAAATIKGWTDIVNTEGYRGLDVDGNAVNEFYYSEWDRGSRTINQFFERLKWLSRRATTESSNAETGNNFNIGNGTITAQAQSFANGAVPQYLTRCFARLKKTGAPTGNLTAKLYDHSGTFGTSSVPTGAALATSVNVDVTKLTTSYQVVEIEFATAFKMLASTNYVISFEKTGGDGSNNVQIEGDTTGTHAGNKSENTGSWAAQAAEDLWFDVHASAELYEMPGERFRGITHEIVVDTPTGTFQAVEPVSWSGGTGQMVAINSPTAATKMWIQLLTGVAPTNDQTITGGQSTATVAVNVTVTERTLSQPFVGVSTGSAIIGSYGLGVQPADLTANDKLFDLDNTQRVPPNIVTFTVSGLVSGEDRVLVGPEDGGALDANQLTLNTTLSAAAETACVVTASIPTDTPSAGTIRIELNSGIYRRCRYSSYTGSTFTFALADSGAGALTINVVASAGTFTRTTGSFLTDGFAPGDRISTTGFTNGGNNATKTILSVTATVITVTDTTGLVDETGNNNERVQATGLDFSADPSTQPQDVFISYVDKLADATTATFQGVFLSNRGLFVRVRDGGGTPIKTFEGTATLGSSGGSITAIRTSDA